MNKLHKLRRPRIVLRKVKSVLRRMRRVVAKSVRLFVLRVALALYRFESIRTGQVRWHQHMLLFGWGNRDMRASPAYLVAVVEACRGVDGPVLEAGSGVTTIAAAAALYDRSIALLSLEQDMHWADRGKWAVRRFTNCHILAVPIVEWGTFSWYESEVSNIAPRDIQLVICDGPPGSTEGGRYGLLPVMRRHLAPGALILLDDAGRRGEQRVLERWSEEFDATYDIVDVDRAFARIRLPKDSACSE